MAGDKQPKPCMSPKFAQGARPLGGFKVMSPTRSAFWKGAKTSCRSGLKPRCSNLGLADFSCLNLTWGTRKP